MPLIRSKYQLDESLKEFYEREQWEGMFAIISKKMLEFIDIVNKHFVETPLFAMTSHQRLCIQKHDERTSEWIVIISNSCLDEYYFEYLVPEYKRPWDNAWITGTAKNLEEAMIYLLISMKESETWKGNEELVALMRQYDLN